MPVIARGLPVYMENAVVPASRIYSKCLNNARDRADRVMVETLVNAARHDIERCSKDRAEAMEQAHLALAATAGWDDPAKRNASITETFDQIDASHIHHAEESAAFFMKDIQGKYNAANQ